LRRRDGVTAAFWKNRGEEDGRRKPNAEKAPFGLEILRVVILSFAKAATLDPTTATAMRRTRAQRKTIIRQRKQPVINRMAMIMGRYPHRSTRDFAYKDQRAR
jgi:hypothetical protein